MGRLGNHILTWFGSLALVCSALLGTMSWMACVPHPVNPGYISVPASTPGAVDISIYGGGGAEFWNENDPIYSGGGGVHIEPYLTRTVSLPISFAAGASDWDGQRAVGGAGRLGIRYRALSWLCVGGGLSGGVYKGDELTYWGTTINEDPIGAFHLDVEFAVGQRWRHVGFSFAIRPSFEVMESYFFLPIESVVAFYPFRYFGITLHIYGGPWVYLEEDHDAGGWIAGGLGISMRFPLKSPD